MIACACDGPAGAFIAKDGRWTFMGTLTFADATAVFEASRGLALPASGVVDLTGVEQADSSALAVMLALKRRAAAEGKTLSFAAVPSGIHSLAHVYGVEEVLAG